MRLAGWLKIILTLHLHFLVQHVKSLEVGILILTGKRPEKLKINNPSKIFERIQVTMKIMALKIGGTIEYRDSHLIRIRSCNWSLVGTHYWNLSMD